MNKSDAIISIAQVSEGNRPIALVDVDGVLADFEKGSLERWMKKYPNLPFIPREERIGQDIRDDYSKLDPAYGSLMRSIMRELTFFSSLSLIDGATDALNLLENEGYDVFLCTSLLRNPSNMARRLTWIKENFDPHWAQRVIMTRDKTLVRGDILIDDNPQIRGCAKPSFTHVIFDHHYNRMEKTKQRIHGWVGASNEISSMYFSPTITECRKPIILVDISNVLLDLEGLCLNKWREYYPLLPFIPISERTRHRIIEEYSAMNTLYGQQMSAMIHEYDFFDTIQMVEGASGILDEMEREGYSVFICTGSFRDYSNVAGKMQFIQRNFGQKWLDRVIITRDKTLIYGDILIDDNPSIKGIKEPSFTHIVFDQAYNRNIGNGPRINKWSEWKAVISNVMINRRMSKY